LVHDLEGSDLPDLDAVRVLALQHARTLISEGVKEGGVPLHLALEVQDESGAVCWTLSFKDAVELIEGRDPANRPAIDFSTLPTRPFRSRRSC